MTEMRVSRVIISEMRKVRTIRPGTLERTIISHIKKVIRIIVSKTGARWIINPFIRVSHDVITDILKIRDQKGQQGSLKTIRT